MNMSYLSIILFCISDAVFRFAFFFGQLLCFFLGDFTQTHTHMHICSVSAACAATSHSLSTLSSLSQALFLLLLPDVSLSLLLRFVLSHLLSCSLTDLSLGLAYQAAVVVAALPACFFCSCCCSFSLNSACCSFPCCCCYCFAAFHGCCLSYSEGAN